MKITSASSNSASGMLNTIVDKIYNLLFGYLDSLFDDANYEKEESTIPKSQVEKPENMVDAEGHEIDPDEVEVTGDAKVIKFLPKMIEAEATEVSEEDVDEDVEPEAQVDPDLDPFTVTIKPMGKEEGSKGWEGWVAITVKNEATGKFNDPAILVQESDKSGIQRTIEKLKKDVSSTIKVSLTKVTGSSGCSVKLKNIYSSYDIPMTCADISCILNDTDFVAALPEGDSTYRIDSYEDGYDVVQLEDYTFNNSIYDDTLDCCIKTMSRIYELSWFAKGVDYNNFHSICETLSYNIQYNVTELAKLCIIHGVEPAFEVKSSDAASVVDKWQSLKDCVLGYISSLQLLLLFCTADEKNMIESWIRQLNDIILYQWACLHPATN